MTEQLFDSWFDPIEPGLRDRTEDFPKTMFEAELEQTLARFRYARQAKLARDDSGGFRDYRPPPRPSIAFREATVAAARPRLNSPHGKSTGGTGTARPQGLERRAPCRRSAPEIANAIFPFSVLARP